jgi:hypothetical protein
METIYVSRIWFASSIFKEILLTFIRIALVCSVLAGCASWHHSDPEIFIAAGNLLKQDIAKDGR